MVISHDRMFLDRVATHILAWEGTDENPGAWYWFEGNFALSGGTVWRVSVNASRPHRTSTSSRATFLRRGGKCYK